MKWLQSHAFFGIINLYIIIEVFYLSLIFYINGGGFILSAAAGGFLQLGALVLLL
jgi:hypothetical protein